MLVDKRKTLSEAKATPMTQVWMTMGEDGGRLMFLGKQRASGDDQFFLTDGTKMIEGK